MPTAQSRAKAKAARVPSFAAFFYKVSTLGEYVSALVDGHRCEADGTSDEFRRFLRTTMVGHDPIGVRLAFYEPAESLNDTVRKVIKRMLSRSASGSGNLAGRFSYNTLAMGFGMRRDGAMNCVSGDSSVANHFINSSVVELSRGRWIQLLERIGTEAMTHLLFHTSVFLPLQNGSFCQLSGLPLVNLPAPKPEGIKSSNGTFSLSNGPAASRKRKRSRTGPEDCCPSRKLKRTESNSRQRSDWLQEAAADKQSLALSSIEIVRGKMLFNSPSPAPHKLCWNLPAKFPLNRSTSGLELARNILSRSKLLVSTPPARLVNLATRMLKLHRKFNYRLRLFSICPAPWQQRPRQKPSSQSSCKPPDLHRSEPNESLGSAPMDTDSDSELDTGAAATPELCPAVDPPNYLEMASSHKDVYMFVQRCVCGVVPRDLIGGRHNHRRLYTLLRTLVSSGRFEAPNLHEAMQRFRLSEASSWLDCHDPAAMDVYAGVIHWILSEFVIRIIGSYFYATESSNGRHRLFFFRKDVWQSISRDAWRELEASGMYAPRSYAEAAATTNNDSANNGAARQNFGLSRIRLLPKERGFRAIVNMRHSFAIKCLNPARPGNDTRAFTRVHVTPTNKQLADVLAALRPWHVAHPELFGSATFGPADLHAKIKQFKTTLQAQPAFGSQRLYMAKLDIHHAYDSIPQARLLELLHKHLPDEEIMVQKFWTLTPSFSRFRPSFLRHGQPSNEFTAFGDLARDLSARRKGLIFGDLCSTSYFHGRAVYNAIAEHIQQNTVITRSGLLRQQRGIPQGSVLSSLLCNFFYGQLEQQHLLPLVNVQSTLMMRVVDDFLIISTDRDQVTAVIERMSRGVSDYGCRLNAAKTLVNFELVRGGQRVPQAESSDFPWCGILINDRTLDVAADYSRLAPPIRLEETVTINVGREAGVALRQKMLAAVRLKMHPLYTDSQLNSRQTVLLNLYQNFVLCAKKFHLICRRLPMRTGNHRYLISVIEDTIALAHILLKCSCRKASIAAQDVKWLGTHAFHRVLAHKQARYPLLLACLARALRHPDAIKLAQTHASVVGSPSNGTVLAIGY